MSLLARLLKQKESVTTSGGIPPGVSDAFYRSLQKRKKNLLTLIAGGVSLCIGLAGGLIYWGIDIIRDNKPAGVTRLISPSPLPQSSLPFPGTTPRNTVQTVASSSTQTSPAGNPTTQTQPKSVARSTQPRHDTAQRISNPTASTVKHVPVASSSQVTPEKETSSGSAEKATLDNLLFSAASAENSQDYGKALSFYKKALEVAPENYRIANNAASVCLAMGRYIAASEYSNKALSLKPDYIYALVNSGIALGKLGDENGALTALQRAVSLDSSNRSALYNLALLQEKSRRTNDAFVTYKHLADLGDARGKLGVARMYERMGNQDEAIQVYRDITRMQDSSGMKEYARQRLNQLGY